MNENDARVDEHVEVFRRGAVELHNEKELRKKLAADDGPATASGVRRLRVKFGMDPSSADLHVGHAVQLLKLRDLQQLGHQIVLIVGDSTAMVGDPSGRNKLRPQLTREAVTEAAAWRDAERAAAEAAAEEAAAEEAAAEEAAAAAAGRRGAARAQAEPSASGAEHERKRSRTEDANGPPRSGSASSMRSASSSADQNETVIPGTPDDD